MSQQHIISKHDFFMKNCYAMYSLGQNFLQEACFIVKLWQLFATQRGDHVINVVM